MIGQIPLPAAYEIFRTQVPWHCLNCQGFIRMMLIVNLQASPPPIITITAPTNRETLLSIKPPLKIQHRKSDSDFRSDVFFQDLRPFSDLTFIPRSNFKPGSEIFFRKYFSFFRNETFCRNWTTMSAKVV